MQIRIHRRGFASEQLDAVEQPPRRLERTKVERQHPPNPRICFFASLFGDVTEAGIVDVPT